jgi:hypothetical protein
MDANMFLPKTTVHTFFINLEVDKSNIKKRGVGGRGREEERKRGREEERK